jgi:hypothetical protein
MLSDMSDELEELDAPTNEEGDTLLGHREMNTQTEDESNDDDIYLENDQTMDLNRHNGQHYHAFGNNGSHDDLDVDDDASGISEITFNSIATNNVGGSEVTYSATPGQIHPHLGIRLTIQQQTAQAQSMVNGAPSSPAKPTTASHLINFNKHIIVNSTPQEWENLGDEASRTQESIGDIIHDVLTNTHSSPLSSSHRQAKTDNDDDNGSVVSSHLSYYAVKKGPLNAVRTPSTAKHSRKQGSKSGKPKSQGSVSSDASVLSATSTVTNNKGSTSLKDFPYSHTQSNSNSSVGSMASSSSSKHTNSSMSAGAGQMGYVALHRAQSTLLNADDFLSASKQQFLSPIRSNTAANKQRNKVDIIGKDSSATAGAQNQSITPVRLAPMVDVQMPNVTRHGGNKHVTYSADQSTLALNSARGGSSGANLPQPPSSVSGPHAPTFMPSFHSSPAIYSSPIHNNTHVAALGAAPVNRRSSMTSSPALLSAVGVSVNNTYNIANSDFTVPVPTSDAHYTHSHSQSRGHEFREDIDNNVGTVTYSPAIPADVYPIRSPFMDPKSKLNSVSISELKKEFFGR